MGLFNEVSESVLGVDNRILKTLRDLVLRPGRVAQADMTPDDSPYMSQVRLFLAMFGLQTFLFSIFKFSEYQTISNFAAQTDRLQAVQGQLPDNVTLEQVDAATIDWFNYSLWPSLIIGVVLYIVVLAILRPDLPLRSHIAIYLTVNNASYLFFFIFMIVGMLVGQTDVMMLLGSILYIGAFLWLLSRFIRKYYSRTFAGAIGKIIVLIVLTVPISLCIYAAQLGAIQYGVHRETGASYFALFQTAVSAAPTRSQDPQS